MWKRLAELTAVSLIALTGCRDSRNPVESTEGAVGGTRSIIVQGPAGTIVVWAEGADLASPLGFNLPFSNGQAKDSIILPVGPNRQLTLMRYGNDGTETHRGTARVDVKAGINQALAVSLSGHSGYNPTAVNLVITGVVPAGTLKLSAPSATLDSGGTFRLTASVYDDKGVLIKQPKIRYASLDPARLTIDPAGNVHAVGNGLGHLVATSDGRASSVVGVLVSGFGWIYVSAGSDITCGIRAGGAGYCWGDNTAFRGGSSGFTDTPTLIAGGLRFTRLSAGIGQHGCGITQTADLYCWGNNPGGVLGTGQSGAATLPARVTGGLHWASVSAGQSQICGITTAGVAYCWGWNRYGEVGAGLPAGTPATAPTQVLLGQPYRSISSGSEYSCGVNLNGSALCWGSNFNGEVGHGTTANYYTTPQLVVGLTSGVREIVSAAFPATCAVTTTVVCWGSNTFGMLLEAQPIVRDRPGPPLNITPLPTQVGLGIGQGCALRSTGLPQLFGSVMSEAICWGVMGNRAGPLNPPWSTQVRVVPRTAGIVQLSVGRVHACGITGTGHLLCWGGGQSGESGVVGGTPNSEPVEIP